MSLGAEFADYKTGMVRQEWRNVLMRDVCVYCGARPKGLDHIHPRRKGGIDGWQNRAPACKPCDSAKSDVPLLMFLWASHKAMIRARRRKYQDEGARMNAFHAMQHRLLRWRRFDEAQVMESQ
jgi:hypothetical protein